MASGSKPNVDHEHVMARHEKYLSPYRSGFVERMMEFLEKDEVQYSSIGNVTHFPKPTFILLSFLKDIQSTLSKSREKRERL